MPTGKSCNCWQLIPAYYIIVCCKHFLNVYILLISTKDRDLKYGVATKFIWKHTWITASANTCLKSSCPQLQWRVEGFHKNILGLKGLITTKPNNLTPELRPLYGWHRGSWKFFSFMVTESDLVQELVFNDLSLETFHLMFLVEHLPLPCSFYMSGHCCGYMTFDSHLCILSGLAVGCFLFTHSLSTSGFCFDP